MSDEIVEPKLYIKVWAALLALLVATIVLAYVPIGPMHIVSAVGISFAKAILIVLFFMHVKYKRRLVWVFVSAGLFWLCILFALSLGDYLTRNRLPTPTLWLR